MVKINMVRRIVSFFKGTLLDALRLLPTSKEGLKSVYGVSLYRNALYLMANSGVNAVLGLVFWVVVARLYSVEEVGLGSALISAGILLSFIGTLGLGFGIIRFLPSSNDKARLLNSCFTISLFASVIIAFIFLAGLPFWSPKLMFLRENLVFLAAFVGFVAVMALYNLLTRTFVGFRRAGFTLANCIIFSVLKIVLVVALAISFKVFGIFASWELAMAVCLIVSFLLFLPQILHRYRPLPSFRRQITNEMVHFSFANFIGELLQNAPAWILPLMVLNLISAEANAYFYITWTMAWLLIQIPLWTSLSFFAEGSYEEEKLSVDLRRSLKMIALLLVPAVVILFLLGDKLLLLFGREYSEGGTRLLLLLVPAAIPASINFLYLGIARVKQKLREIILVTGAIAFGTLILSYLLLPYMGILGAGVGWLASQMIVAIVLLPRLKT